MICIWQTTTNINLTTCTVDVICLMYLCCYNHLEIKLYHGQTTIQLRFDPDSRHTDKWSDIWRALKALLTALWNVHKPALWQQPIPLSRSALWLSFSNYVFISTIRQHSLLPVCCSIVIAWKWINYIFICLNEMLILL